MITDLNISDRKITYFICKLLLFKKVFDTEQGFELNWQKRIKYGKDIEDEQSMGKELA